MGFAPLAAPLEVCLVATQDAFLRTPFVGAPESSNAIGVPQTKQRWAGATAIAISSAIVQGEPLHSCKASLYKKAWALSKRELRIHAHIEM